MPKYQRKCPERLYIKDGVRSKHKLYQTWSGVKQRCRNPNCPSYAYYGAKGINVCDEWFNDFHAFVNHLTSIPSYNESLLGKGEGGLTLDRINNNGNYEPGNVRWATAKEQYWNSSLPNKLQESRNMS